MIIIKTEKVVLSSGIKARKILKIQALAKEKLPLKYINSPNKAIVYKASLTSSELFISKGNECYRIYPTLLIPENRFQTLLTLIMEAGENLKEVNEELKELKESWNGTENFKI